MESYQGVAHHLLGLKRPLALTLSLSLCFSLCFSLSLSLALCPFVLRRLLDLEDTEHVGAAGNTLFEHATSQAVSGDM